MCDHFLRQEIFRFLNENQIQPWNSELHGSRVGSWEKFMGGNSTSKRITRSPDWWLSILIIPWFAICSIDSVEIEDKSLLFTGRARCSYPDRGKHGNGHVSFPSLQLDASRRKENSSDFTAKRFRQAFSRSHGIGDKLFCVWTILFLFHHCRQFLTSLCSNGEHACFLTWSTDVQLTCFSEICLDSPFGWPCSWYRHCLNGCELALEI